jgi:drug/metabolite transporter (DMT)-like permease
MNWQVIATVAPILFVAYQALSKLLPKDISVFLVNAYVSAVGVIVMLILYFFTSETKSLSLGTKYLPLALGIGILISLGNAAIIKAYGLGATQSGFSSLFYPLLIIYAVVIGLIFWQEKLNIYQSIGIALAIVGMFLITYFKH